MRDQRPPIGETQRIRVSRSREYDDDMRPKETALILYERREDGWYVAVPAVDTEFWKFARESARDRDVRQLINKKWCMRYNPDPDPLDDRS